MFRYGLEDLIVLDKGFDRVLIGFVGFGKTVSFDKSLADMVLNDWYALVKSW